MTKPTYKVILNECYLKADYRGPARVWMSAHVYEGSNLETNHSEWVDLLDTGNIDNKIAILQKFKDDAISKCKEHLAKPICVGCGWRVDSLSGRGMCLSCTRAINRSLP